MTTLNWFSAATRARIVLVCFLDRGVDAGFFAGLVAAAAERGELAPDIDRQALADLLGAVLTGLADGEACDDGNTTADDGCSADCQVEPGWSCCVDRSGNLLIEKS